MAFGPWTMKQSQTRLIRTLQDVDELAFQMAARGFSEDYARLQEAHRLLGEVALGILEIPQLENLDYVLDYKRPNPIRTNGAHARYEV